MHEYSLMERVIETIHERLATQGVGPSDSVKEVILKVGALAIHSEASCRQAYEILSQNTMLEGSRLTLVIVPATLECPICSFMGSYPEGRPEAGEPMPLAECPICGARCNLLGGRGVESIEIILEADGSAD